MIYFNECSNLEEVKATFKNLAKKFHPDLSGFDSTAIMQEINKEYKYAIAQAAKFGTKKDGQKYTDQEVNDEILNAEEYKKCLEILLKLEGITIVLAGSWLFIGGNTYAHKTQIKDSGCIWCNAKKVWAFRGVDYKSSKKGKPMELSKIFALHGYQPISAAQKKFNYLAQ